MKRLVISLCFATRAAIDAFVHSFMSNAMVATPRASAVLGRSAAHVLVHPDAHLTNIALGITVTSTSTGCHHNT